MNPEKNTPCTGKPDHEGMDLLPDVITENQSGS